MANVINRTTLEIRMSVNTPDYDPAEWLINPDLAYVDGVEYRYLKIDGESVVEMTDAEKATVDAAEESARIEALKAEALALVQQDSGLRRLLIAMSVVNKRELAALKNNSPRASKSIEALMAETVQAILADEVQ